MHKIIIKRLNKTCACCASPIKVIIYSKKDYRGGHYFGKIPICTEKEWAKARKAGTKPWNLHGTILHVMKKDPIPYKFEECWECPKCYWGK
jgi:hypothetical protein